MPPQMFEIVAVGVRDAGGHRDGLPAGAALIGNPSELAAFKPDVVAEADFSGSTSGIINYVREHKPKQALLVTECSMASNISDELPEVDFVGPCNMCPYMKKITLEKVLYALHTMTGEVEVDPAVAEKAKLAVTRMIDLSRELGI